MFVNGTIMFEVLLAVLAAGAYGIGSVPVHRAFGLTDIDTPVRENVRCRSLARVLLNMLKGLIVVEIGLLLGPGGALVALFAVSLGHNFPIWTSFRGGTGLGVILGGTVALDPTLALICLSAWMFAYYSFADRTVAALTSATVAPFAALFLQLSYPIYLLLPVTGLVVWSHRKRFSGFHLNNPDDTGKPVSRFP